MQPSPMTYLVGSAISGATLLVVALASPAVRTAADVTVCVVAMALCAVVALCSAVALRR